jgi:hypothetical protein
MDAEKIQVCFPNVLWVAVSNPSCSLSLVKYPVFLLSSSFCIKQIHYLKIMHTNQLIQVPILSLPPYGLAIGNTYTLHRYLGGNYLFFKIRNIVSQSETFNMPRSDRTHHLIFKYLMTDVIHDGNIECNLLKIFRNFFLNIAISEK